MFTNSKNGRNLNSIEMQQQSDEFMLNGLSGGLPEYGLTQPIISTYTNKNDLSGEVTDNHKKEDQESVDYEPFLGLAGT